MKRLCSILLTLALLIGIAPVETLLAEGTYTVTYTDPEHTFEDQVYTVNAGDKVPAFEGYPEREDYVFTGWDNRYKANSPINMTVTEDLIFTANWLPTDGEAELDEGGLNQASVNVGIAFASDDSVFEAKLIGLIDGTYEIGESRFDNDKMAFVAEIVINNFDPYVSELHNIYKEDGYDCDFVLDDNKMGDSLTIYMINRISYDKQSNGSYTTRFFGWTKDATMLVNNPAQIYVLPQYTITFNDGVENAEIFADFTEKVLLEDSFTAAIPEVNNPAREGYVFDGWNTEADGSGDDYYAGDLYTFPDDPTGNGGMRVTLYAQWTRKTANTLQYDANGGEGGPVNNFTNGQTITVQTKQPTREGYIFDGWNTETDGTGQTYKAGDTILIDPDNVGGQKLMLYAQWIAETPIELHIYRNDNTEEPYKTVRIHGYKNGDTFELSSIDLNELYDVEAYESTFGTIYKNKGEFKWPAEDEFTINGWTHLSVMVTDQYRVRLWALKNHNSDEDINPIGAKVSSVDDNVYEVVEDLYNENPYTIEGYEAEEGFYNMATHQAIDENMLVGESEHNIYVNYLPIEYTITLDTDGGNLPEGSGNEITYTIEDESVSLPKPTKEGYAFKGWYNNGTLVEEFIPEDILDNVTLKASWEEDNTPPTVKIGDYVAKDGETVYIDKDAKGINIYAYDDNGIHFWYRGSDQPGWQSGNWLPFDNDNWDGKPSELRVSDDAGNTTTVYFMFDRTLPVISGVEDGKTYEGSVSPIISDNSGNVSSTLDGEAYDGSTITKEGTHTLIATDGSGNTVTVTFTIKAKEEVKSSTPSISCAGEKDKNCDGVITCDEEKGEGWTWNNAKGVCEYTGAYTVVNTGVK